MWDEDVEFLRVDLCGVQCPLSCLAHLECRPAENAGALHPQVGALFAVAFDELEPVDVLADRVVLRTVAAPDDRADALGFGGSEDNGTGAVTEDEAVAAIGHVERDRQLLGSDDENVGGTASADHVGADTHRVAESGASDGDVESGHAVGAERGGDCGAGTGGEQQVGVGGDDDGVDVRTAQQRIGNGLASGIDGHRGDVLVRPAEPPGLDSGAGVDPFIAGVDRLADLCVGDHAIRPIGADAENPDVVDPRFVSDDWHAFLFSLRLLRCIGRPAKLVTG